MSPQLRNIILFIIAAVSVAASYTGLNASLAIDSLYWKLLCAMIAFATGAAIFGFWKEAFEVVTKPDQFRYRSAGWIAILIGSVFLTGMSSWWNVAGIGGPEAKRAALYDTVQMAERRLSETIKQNTGHRDYLSRLEGFSGEIWGLVVCEGNSGCVTGSPGKKGVYQTLKQMHSKVGNIIKSVRRADAKLVARAEDGKKCLPVMRKALTSGNGIEAQSNGVSASMDCINAAMSDIASLNQLERIAQEMTSFTAGLVVPVSVKTSKQKQAVANIFAGMAKRARKIADDARRANIPANFEPLSIRRMSSMKAVIIYYDSVLPSWITGIGLDLLPLILLSFRSTLAASRRSRQDSPARNYTVHEYLEVRDLGKLIREEHEPEIIKLESPTEPGVIVSPVNRIAYKDVDGELPDYWYEEVEVEPKDDEKEPA